MRPLKSKKKRYVVSMRCYWVVFIVEFETWWFHADWFTHSSMELSFFSTQEKDKKKGKNKPAGKENSAQDGKQKRMENKPNEAAISSIQTVTEAASDNKSKDKGNSSDTKPDVQGKTRKYEGMVCVTVERSPRKLPPIEPNKKTTTTSKATEPKRKEALKATPKVRSVSPIRFGLYVF